MSNSKEFNINLFEGDIAQLVEHWCERLPIQFPVDQTCEWLGRSINMECSARLEISLGFNPATEGK